MIKSTEYTNLFWKLKFSNAIKVIYFCFLVLVLYILYVQNRELGILKNKVKTQKSQIDRLENRLKNIEYYLD